MCLEAKTAGLGTSVTANRHEQAASRRFIPRAPCLITWQGTKLGNQ